MNTLKETFNLHPDESGLSTGLINWYNNVINKTYDELDVADVAKMYRQDILIEVAIEKAIDLFLINPYDGEYSDGGLMQLIASMDLRIISSDKMTQLKLLLEKISCDYKQFEWCTEEDMNNFKSNIDLLRTQVIIS